MAYLRGVVQYDASWDRRNQCRHMRYSKTARLRTPMPETNSAASAEVTPSMASLLLMVSGAAAAAHHHSSALEVTACYDAVELTASLLELTRCSQM
jgi:hypothetical protein